MHERLVACAEQLGAAIIQLPAAIKTRLVVHAQSSHHENTIAVHDSCLAQLVQEMSKRRSGSAHGTCRDRRCLKSTPHVCAEATEAKRARRSSGASAGIAGDDQARDEGASSGSDSDAQLDAWVDAVSRPRSDPAEGIVIKVPAAVRERAQSLVPVRVPHIVNPYLLKLNAITVDAVPEKGINVLWTTIADRRARQLDVAVRDITGAQLATTRRVSPGAQRRAWPCRQAVRAPARRSRGAMHLVHGT